MFPQYIPFIYVQVNAFVKDNVTILVQPVVANRNLASVVRNQDVLIGMEKKLVLSSLLLPMVDLCAHVLLDDSSREQDPSYQGAWHLLPKSQVWPIFATRSGFDHCLLAEFNHDAVSSGFPILSCH